jgi:mRNA interferase HigB
MHVLTYKRIKEFSSRHPQSSVSLSNWYKRMNKLKLESVNDVKKKFSGVDYIGYNRFVFNISGNKYRIVASIIFASRKVYIKFIGTHSEYSKINFRKS